MKGIARGYIQRRWLEDMQTINGLLYPPSLLRGRAKMYSGRYLSSFYNLLERLEKSGWKVRRELGPQGGLWSSRWWATPPETVD